MPRNSGGIYTAPVGTLGVPATSISSTAYDTFVADLSTELTNSVNTAGTAPLLAALNMGGFKIINAATPVAATDVAIKSYVDGVIPPGMIMAFGYNNAAAALPIPAGWLVCDGSVLSTTTYSALFGAISYIYGGSGSNFNIPDFRGCFLRGFDNSRGLDFQGTRVTGGFQTSYLINHFHSVNDPTHNHSISQSPHTHVDAGHSHGVNDPTHTHTTPNTGLGSGVNLASGSGFNLVNTTTTSASATGISIQTGFAQSITANANVTNVAAATGISVLSPFSVNMSNTETTVVNYPVLWLIKF